MTTNAEAATSTIEAMRAGGLLEDVDAALVQLVLDLALALDVVDPGRGTYPQLVRQYLAALTDLRRLSRGGSDLGDLVERVQAAGRP